MRPKQIYTAQPGGDNIFDAGTLAAFQMNRGRVASSGGFDVDKLIAGITKLIENPNLAPIIQATAEAIHAKAMQMQTMPAAIPQPEPSPVLYGGDR